MFQGGILIEHCSYRLSHSPYNQKNIGQPGVFRVWVTNVVFSTNLCSSYSSLSHEEDLNVSEEPNSE